jgi:hypothetical protein
VSEPRRQDAAHYRQRALAALSLSEEQVAEVPQIAHVIKKAGLSDELWDILSASDNGDIRKLLKVRGDLAAMQRKHVPIEALCLAADVSTKKALEIITTAVYEHSSLSSNLLAAVAHPSIVEASVAAALTRQGTKDRDMLFKHSNFTPLPKTSILSVRGNVNQVGGTQQNLTVLPAVEQTVRQLSDRFNMELTPPEPAQIAAPADDEPDFSFGAEDNEYDGEEDGDGEE